jgi:hypothetical protein
MAVGRAAVIGHALGLPLANPRSDLPDGSPWPPSADRYYVPGSILRAEVDPHSPLGYGFEREVDVFFDNGPVFRLLPSAPGQGVRAVARFSAAAPLRSGWARGQEHLRNAATVVDVPLGRGRVLLFGPEITFRGQPHGTFKFLFNGIHYAASVRTDLVAPDDGSRP